MIKASIQSIQAKKVWSFFIISILTISITANLSLVITTEGIKNSLLEVAYEEYGEHAGVIKDPSLISDEFEVGNYGVMGIVTESPFGIKATIGWMDKEAIQIGRIKLLKGSMPRNENEVVVEKYYYSQLNNKWKIGEEKTLRIDGQDKGYKLVGIIDDYAFKWIGPIDVEKGINDFPNIITVNDNSVNDSNSYLLVRFNGSVNNMKSQIEELTMNDEHSFVNDRLFYTGLIDYDTLSGLTRIFQIIILIFTYIGLYTVFSFYRLNLSEQIGIYKSVGFTNRDVIKKEIIQITTFFIISCLFSIPIIIVITNFLVKNTFQSAIYVVNWKMILGGSLSLLTIFIFSLISLIINLRKLFNYSVISLLKGSFKREIINRRSSKSKSFNLSILNQQICNYPKQFIVTIGLFSFCIFSVVFSLYLEKESAGIWDTNADYYATFSGYGFKHINHQVVMETKHETFNYDLLNKLETTEKVAAIEKSPFMLDVIPVFETPQQTPSIKDWINHSYPTESETRSFKSTYSTDQALPLNNIRYVWLTEEEYTTLQKLYGTVNEFGENQLMLFVPSEYKDNQLNKLTGQSIVLRKIAANRKGLYEQSEWKYKVDAAVNKPFEYRINKNETISYSEPTIVMIDNQALNNQLSTGYREMTVYLDTDINEQELTDIENQIKQIVAPIPNVLYQDLAQFRIEDTKISKTLGFFGRVNFIIISLLSGFSIILFLYSKFISQKVRWAVYLANGMTKNRMFILLTTEVFCAYVISCIICTFIFTTFMYFSNSQYPIFYYIFDLIFGCASIFTLIIVSLIAIRISINSISIISLIRFRE